MKHDSFRPTVKYAIIPCTPKIIIKKIYFFFFIKYKNEWNERKLWRQNIKTSDFYKNKKVIKIDDINANKILVSKEEPYGIKSSFKYFIAHSDNDVIRPLFIKLPQMIGYVRKCEGNTTMSFKINDSKLLKKYNQIIHKDKNKNIWWQHKHKFSR